MAVAHNKMLGTYLKDRRSKLDAAALGFVATRRRTPGLRREEVAQRANISATWYTWLEQGRGGAPSARVLEQISRALMLTEAEREHLFLIALGRPPEIHPAEVEGVTPRLQRVLDSLELSPALIKTTTWDVVAWNQAATAVFADYGKLPPAQRNILRLMFLNPQVRARNPEWESVARFVVAAFRADAARAGDSKVVDALVEELSRESPEFLAMWSENDVCNYGEGTKNLTHPAIGLIGLEYSAFAVDGRPDLGMIVYNPATPKDARRIKILIDCARK